MAGDGTSTSPSPTPRIQTPTDVERIENAATRIVGSNNRSDRYFQLLLDAVNAQSRILEEIRDQLKGTASLLGSITPTKAPEAPAKISPQDRLLERALIIATDPEVRTKLLFQVSASIMAKLPEVAQDHGLPFSEYEITTVAHLVVPPKGNFEASRLEDNVRTLARTLCNPAPGESYEDDEIMNRLLSVPGIPGHKILSSERVFELAQEQLS